MEVIKQNSHLNKCVHKFYIEFIDSFNPEELTNCTLFVYNNRNISDLNPENESKNIQFKTQKDDIKMFKTHLFIPTENKNIYEINFWNHDKALPLHLLEQDYRILLFCPKGKQYFIKESNEKKDIKTDEFWYKNHNGQYGIIRFLAGLWGHGWKKMFDSKHLSDLRILNIWKFSLKNYFDLEKEKINEIDNSVIGINTNELHSLYDKGILTNDASYHFIDDNYNIYSQSYINNPNKILEVEENEDIYMFHLISSNRL